MPPSYPLAMPTVGGIKSIKLRHSSVSDGTTSPYTGEEQIQAFPGQWWAAEIVLGTLNKQKVGEWEAFLGRLNGRVGTFLLGDPSKSKALGSASEEAGTPVVDGNHTVRAQSVYIATGLTARAGYLKAGDHIQIGLGANARLHMLLEDMNLDASGKGSADIWPRTRLGLNGGEEIIVAAPKGVFRLAQSDFDVARRPGVYSDIGFNAREAL